MLFLKLNRFTSSIRLISQALLLVLGLPGILQAQTENKYKPGYVVMPLNDTLNGFILETKIVKVNKALHFRKTLTDTNVQVFKPEQVKSFVILGNSDSGAPTQLSKENKSKFILSQPGPFDLTNFWVLDRLVYSAKVVNINDQDKDRTLFLREVIAGKVSLYIAYNEQQQEKYYLQNESSELLALTEKNYLGMLKVVLKNCPELSFDQKGARDRYPLNLKSLTQIISTYNVCAYPSELVVYNNLNKTIHQKWTAGIKAGTGLSHIRYTEAVSADLARSPSRNNPEIYTPKKSFSGGVFAQVNFGGGLSLQPEILFMQKGGSVEKEIYTGTPTRYRDFDNRTFLFNYLQLPLAIHYQANMRFKPYLAVGIIMGKELSRRLTVEYYREQDSQPRTELPEPKEIDFQKAEVGGMVGAGCHIPISPTHNFVVEFRYEKTRLPKYATGILNVTTWQLQTGITLF